MERWTDNPLSVALGEMLKADRQTDRHTSKKAFRQTDKQTERHSHIKTSINFLSPAVFDEPGIKLTNRQTNRQTDGQT